VRPVKVIADADLAAFAAKVAPWLAHDPVRNNVIATVISARLDGLVAPEEGLLLLRIVDQDGRLAGLAVRTPPQAMLVPHLPPEAITALIEYLGRHATDVDAFNGPAHVAQEIATAVAARTGAAMRQSRGLGRFTLNRVIAPVAPAGRPRPAEIDDVSLLREWVDGFHHDIGSSAEPDSSNVDQRVRKGLLWLWETTQGRPVAMSGLTEPTHGIIRVNAVYTPPEHRRHGYASALVAHLSQRILDGGHVPTLFTDLSNDTSNRIYQAIGYRKLDEAAHWQVIAPAEQPANGQRG
jgi:predicted GNAT family acetyltransferase